ncbi:ABC transporter substrate-binding protein [Leucobacter tenebrionis]|uniref:ABC transporter substrate-binding protein n=1 Tax=Leucobacter tenebrionis TaxID=2873270 RepID=UPI001CA79AC1|nr:ABC transporter substrate-binding protein [Leucobacter tenebrionis]QZY53205.1 ABC transporter substrate-binding protein [Leucobacter tenebrionis]
MKIRKLAFIGLAAAAAVSLAACSSSAPSGEGAANSDEPIKIRIQSQASIAAEPMYMCVEDGTFEKEGLDVEVTELPDLPAATAALQAGKLELAFVPTISALTMARQNVPITMIAAADGINPAAADASLEEQREYTSVGVYVSKGSGIESIEDMGGDTSIAVPELKGQPDGTITSVLHEAGVDTADIEWLKLGFQPALDALKSDQLDAAFLVSPFSIEADEAGLKRVMNPSVEFFPKGSATTSWAGNTEWVEKNPEAVERFQTAIQKCNAAANENLDEVKQHVIDRAGLKLSPADMPQSYFPETIDPDQLAEVDQKLTDIEFFPETIDVTEILSVPGK